MKVAFLDTVHPILWERLHEAGFECEDLTKTPDAELLPEIRDVHGIVIRSRIPMNQANLGDCENLKFIARSGAGLENIDLEYCHGRNIMTFNAPEGNRQAVGEHALGMILALFNRMHLAKGQISSGIWDREGNRGHELSGKTVGIIGFGNNGSAFGRCLSGFDVEILAFDKYDQSYIQKAENVRSASLEEIQEKADVISFHTPLTDETRGMYNSQFISNCAKPHYIINVARGSVVKSSDLVDGLKHGKVLGACLDVLEFESSSFENWLDPDALHPDLAYLIHSERVVMTPHVAGWSQESYYKLSSVLADKVLATASLLPRH